MFLVIEWIDGSGKGTQVELLREKLEGMGKTVKILDFPRYKEQSSFMVHSYLNGNYGKLEEIGPELASMFYAIDRFDAKKEIIESLSKYDYVIANRYVSSNMIHQSAKIDSYAKVDAFLEWVYDLEYNVFSIPKPNVVIFLKIDPKTSQKLIESKAKRDYIKGEKGEKNKDLHEENFDFMRRSAEMAIYVTKKYNNWITIDCEEEGKLLEKEIITEKILKVI